jgi:DNA-binding beta-propeller fold protein YncE
MINTRRQILQWTGAGAGAVAFGSLGSVFAATAADRMIVVSNGGGTGVPPSMTLLDPDTLDVLVTLSAPGAFSFPATRWAFSRDIVWGGYQEKIAGFSLATGAQVAAAETKSNQNYTEVTPDGRFVLSAARLVDKVFKVAASGPQLGAPVEVIDHYQGAGACDMTITKDGKYAFTPDRTGETISTFEVDPLKKVATVPVERRGTVPLEPYMATVSPRGDYLFVENARGNGSESVFDIRNPLRPVEVVRWDQSNGLGTNPLTDEFTPDGRFNLIMNRGSSDLTVVDVDQLRITGRIALPDGSNPMTGVFTPEGTRFFVPLPGRDAVAVVAVPEFKVTKMIPVGTRPMGAVYLENPLPRRQGMITPLGSALEEARVFPADCPDECCGPL